ncbi:uncharacterized protein LOC111262745 isoform X2 [Varroa jacobsoni]|uniref:Colipase n=1 Tax=Varroa destructor TaxID=109461 RepID=A0A7M7K306_VARDE|nr:uncharacterized protein LOC111250240 isoform X2 [Varroa destructor]XP_022692968.1 uncharacterized protein LOC111262745 isoform X2 [Varroa jacobsoni]
MSVSSCRCSTRAPSLRFQWPEMSCSDRTLLQFIAVIFVINVHAAMDQDRFNPFEQKDISRDLNGVLFTEIKNLTVGEVCRWNHQCESSCCVELVDSPQGRQCANLGTPGKSCSTTNVKGGYFVGACPCIDSKGCIRLETSLLGQCQQSKDVTIISTTVQRTRPNNSIVIRY